MKYEIHQLTLNYRSGVNIVEAANRLMAGPDAWSPIESAIDGLGQIYHVHMSSPEAQLEKNRSGSAIVSAANRLMAKDEPGSEIVSVVEGVASVVEHYQCDDPEDQLHQISEAIPVMVKDGHKSIAILCRYNWQCLEVATHLRSQNIAVSHKQRQATPEGWKEAVTMVAFFADVENDELAYSVLCATQGEAVANTARMTAMARIQSINQAVIHAPVASLEAVLPGLARANIPKPVLLLVERAIAELPPFGKTVDLAAALQSGYVLDQLEGEPEGVQVMTQHGSKGLEFDSVIIPYATDLNLASKSEEALAEERRLFYVAITRARRTCVILSTATAKTFDKATELVPTKPSRFIADAGLTL